MQEKVLQTPTSASSTIHWDGDDRRMLSESTVRGFMVENFRAESSFKLRPVNPGVSFPPGYHPAGMTDNLKLTGWRASVPVAFGGNPD